MKEKAEKENVRKFTSEKKMHTLKARKYWKIGESPPKNRATRLKKKKKIFFFFGFLPTSKKGRAGSLSECFLSVPYMRTYWSFPHEKKNRYINTVVQKS